MRTTHLLASSVLHVAHLLPLRRLRIARSGPLRHLFRSGESMTGLGILSAAFAAALVVVCGALYAACLAFGRLRASTALTVIASLAYLGLVASALTLAGTLGLRGAWWVVVATMLVGYWFLPRAIWRLSTATHAAEIRATPSPTEE
jgi:hypothetical protein